MMLVKHNTSQSGIFINMEDIAKQVGQNIKDARKLKNLTQKEVANYLHMTQQQYSRFENGVFELNYSQILQICDLLDITPNEVFEK